jgi:predicted metal-dependent HD superfamily phosphohydrolase
MFSPNEYNSMSIFQRSWARLNQGLQLQLPDSLRDTLLQHYREPQRHYHTVQHLEECLQGFEYVQDKAQYPAELELALWFHDAIYDVHAHDNELSSASWAVRELEKYGTTTEQSQRIHDLIMATLHTAKPTTLDAQLMVDIDLSILGAETARFAEYEAQIRREYSYVPSFVFKFKRREILKKFLERTQIYTSAYFYQNREQQARQNLEAAIKK